MVTSYGGRSYYQVWRRALSVMERPGHFLGYREALALNERVTMKEFVELRGVCERVFPVVGLEKADIDKTFKDAQGDPGDVVSSMYGHLLEAGENPDELLEGLQVYENLE
jgi:hypothetical protein